MNSTTIKSWEIPSSTGKHFDFLDGIRGIAILMVVCYHTFYVNPQSPVMVRIIGGVFGMGGLGVSIFFVLSGFLISLPFFQLKSRGQKNWYPRYYARRRFAKIFPPFWLSILIFLTYYLIRYSDIRYLYTALEWMVGLPNFIPENLFFNGVYWSLVVEVHFYILLPVFFFIARNLSVCKTSFFIFTLLLVVPFIVRMITWPSAAELTSGNQNPVDLIGFILKRFPCSLNYFGWGVLFSGFYVFVTGGGRTAEQSHPNAASKLCWIGYVGAILICATVLTGAAQIVFQPDSVLQYWNVELQILLISVSTFLTLFFIFDPDCLGARLLSCSWLQFIGIVSYEWFLFHGPVIFSFKEISGSAHGNWLHYGMRTVCPVFLTFIFAVLVYRYFSLPIMNKLRRR